MGEKSELRDADVTDVCMPVRAVCKPHSPDLKKRRSRDANAEFWVKSQNCGMQLQNSGKKVRIAGCNCRILGKKSELRDADVTDVCMPVRAVCKPHSPDLKKRRSRDAKAEFWEKGQN